MSRRQRAVTIVLLALVIACSPALVFPQQAAAEPEDLKRRHAEFFAALASRDLDRMIDVFANEAVLHVADMPAVRGREAIRQFYARLFGFLVASEATSDGVRVAAGQDMAYDLGRTRNVFKRGPEEVEYTGKYVTVWAKADGVWRIAAYAITGDAPSR